mmetsp:Transcript_8381/g.25191  ORF Transcript_8381/g.25191 Transcript_8381/m.25191 type:complete len:147 (+) Transcript_8381:365-805(+)
MNSMTRSKVSVVLPCVHKFCFGCIHSWLNKGLLEGQPTCPVCRCEVEQLIYTIRSSTSYKSKVFLKPNESHSSDQRQPCSADASTTAVPSAQEHPSSGQPSQQDDLDDRARGQIQQGVDRQRLWRSELERRRGSVQSKTRRRRLED